MSESPLLRLRNVSVQYPSRHGAVLAVDRVDLDVERGHTIGLVGESGSGKSSLGNAIVGLVPTAGGTVEFDGKDITRPSSAERRLLARRIQVVFQDPFGSMNHTRTVGDTVGEALRYNLELDSGNVRSRVLSALADVGLPESAMSRYPSQFSGGQRQRIAIARAIAIDPDFIVCDEPVSALDLSVQAQVLNVLASLRTRRSLSYLFVSHDLSVVRYLSDEIVVMFAGRVVERGAAETVADRPSHPYTRALVAAAPVPDPAEQARRRARRRRLSIESIDASRATGCAFAGRCPFAIDRCRVETPELRPHQGGVVACHRAEDIDALERTDLIPTPLGGTP
jgi:oligopeptide/dipeptide ABC transporter ATP-binding protein